MSGLDKIIASIKAESDANCDRLIADAQAKAQQILMEAKKEGKEKAQEILNDAREAANNRISLAESAALQDYKQIILAKKVELIKEVLSQAVATLKAMPEDEYFDVLIKLSVKHALSQEGIMKLSSKDYARMPKDFEEKLNHSLAGKKIKLSKETISIDGGFVLVYGDIEINCTFDALANEISEHLKAQANSILF